MSLLQNSNAIPTAGATDFYEHQIANSVRMVAPSSTSSSNARLTQTFSTVDSNVHFTLNFWIKRSAIEGNNPVSSARPLTVFTPRSSTSGSVLHEFQFGATGSYGAGDAFAITNTNSGTYILSTNNLFRDTAAWYNIHIQADLDNGTASEKLKIFVNGTEASYNVDNRSSYSSMAGIVAGAWTIGDYYNYGYPIQSYLAQWAYVDGSTLAPTVFAEEKNGVWIPKDLSSGITWGSAGHLLMFQDSSALGDDTSGEGNDWTSSNLSAHDQMLDSPTFGSSSSGNFPTLNPLFPHEDMTFSEGNLKHSTSTNNRGVMCNIAIPKTGKWYWEHLSVAFHNPGGNETHNVGVNIASVDIDGSDRGGRSTGITYASYNGGKSVEADSTASYGTGWAEGDIVGVEFDADNGTINFSKNGSWQGDISLTTAQQAKEWFPFVGMGGASNQEIGIFNFGQDSSFAGEKTAQGNADENGYGDFYYSPPSGVLALNSANLPTADAISPAETDDNYPQKLFNTKLYTGTGSSNALTGVGFKPDWTWIKERGGANDHKLTDSTRGVTKAIESNTQVAQTTDSNGLTAFGTDGFTVGSDAVYNNSSDTYVGWNWRANGGTTASNGNGDIASVTQADPSGGFSIVTYTGSGTAGDTIGHGLSTTPDMIMIKNRSSVDSWAVYSSSLGNTIHLALDTNAAQVTSSAYWNSTSPTSSVFTVGTGDALNQSTKNYVAYCFANIEGYIKAGSYNSNTEASDNAFVYTGFRPAFLLVKATGSGHWQLIDNKRNGFNPQPESLDADRSNASRTNATDFADLLANGFKIRTDNQVLGEAAQNPYVYLAIAENPFAFATAR